MTLRLYRYFQALVMIFLGIFLTTKIVSGTLSWYIHQRFMPLTVLAVIALFVIGQAVFSAARRTPQAEHQPIGEHDHQHIPSAWQIGIVMLPLAVGLLIPAQPLNTQALNGKGVSASAPVTAGGAGEIKFDQAADERNILDWIRLFNSGAAPDTYLGQSANVIGFVYHDPRLPANQFMVSRFTIVCCAADAFALGMVVEWPESAALPADAWIKVKGSVEPTALDGQKMLLIRATSIQDVQQPEQPYLFP